MMSGAWLDAYTPTSLAMAGPRRRLGAGAAHLREKLALGHARDDEVEAQQIGIHPRGQEHDVVALDRLAHLGLQWIAVEDLLAVRTVLRAEGRGALQVEEKLAQPVVSHGDILPRSRVGGTNLTGRVRHDLRGLKRPPGSSGAAGRRAGRRSGRCRRCGRGSAPARSASP